MEYILEMNEKRQITLPEEIIHEMELEAGAHFKATAEAGQLVIESLPFSSTEQAKAVEKTIESLQKKR